MSATWIAPDADNEPTLWTGDPERPTAVARRCENPALFDAIERVRGLATELAAYDIVTDGFPDEVDVPDDFEYGVNLAGARIWQALEVQP